MNPLQTPTNLANSAAQSSQALQLNDIHLPEQISQLPTAIGWWLLASIIIILTIWLVVRFKNHKKLNRSKTQALSILNKQKLLSHHDLIALLKWSAMQYFDRQTVANLYGNSFQQFLVAQLPEKYRQEFTQLSELAFIRQYQASIEPEEESITRDKVNAKVMNNDCRNAVELWLTQALPPQVNAKENSTDPLIKAGLAHD